MRHRAAGSGVPVRRGILAVAFAVGAGGCAGGVATLSFPSPPPSGPSQTTLPGPADYSGVTQARVPGSTTTTVPAVGPGGATIDGSIVGPSGPVAGATVQAERIVNGIIASTQATTGADGSFTIPNLLGGVYRVRAWQPPSLALTTPQLFFMGATETHAMTLSLDSFSGVQVATSMAPRSLLVGDSANVVVAVTLQTVGTDGVVRPMPQGGQSVTLDGGGGWALASPDPTVTDGNGHAAFRVTCQTSPAPNLVATVTGGAPLTVRTSSCLTPAPTTTTLPGSPETTSTTTALGQPPNT